MLCVRRRPRRTSQPVNHKPTAIQTSAMGQNPITPLSVARPVAPGADMARESRPLVPICLEVLLLGDIRTDNLRAILKSEYRYRAIVANTIDSNRRRELGLSLQTFLDRWQL